jgi:hypothetical protein
MEKNACRVVSLAGFPAGKTADSKDRSLSKIIFENGKRDLLSASTLAAHVYKII